MRIPAPNFTQTPNIFFDEIMKELNEGELRIILLIMRQTFGWHRPEDWMTLGFFSKGTGYDRRSICRILDRLIEKKLINKRVVGKFGNQKCFYSLVVEKTEKEEVFDPNDGVESDEEKAIFKKVIPVTGESPPPHFQKSYTSDRRVTRPVTGGSPTKETL